MFKAGDKVKIIGRSSYGGNICEGRICTVHRADLKDDRATYQINCIDGKYWFPATSVEAVPAEPKLQDTIGQYVVNLEQQVLTLAAEVERLKAVVAAVAKAVA